MILDDTLLYQAVCITTTLHLSLRNTNLYSISEVSYHHEPQRRRATCLKPDRQAIRRGGRFPGVLQQLQRINETP